ncbi:MAG: amidase [Burkholderiales bacterium]|nr:amidase [Burkholderiales bacterium]
MAVKRPTLAQLQDVALSLGMHLSDEHAGTYNTLLQPSFDAYDLLDALPDYLPPVTYPRTPGYRPGAEENKYGAWYHKTTIKGAAKGKLAGKTVAVKDNVCVAGVPMMNGASTLEGYVPNVDATVVTRLLDAGATILGKSVCEYYCFSGGSHTASTGPVHNPRRMGYSAGGSSSGSAALVAAGEVDMAVGGDQGGSVRIPSAYCGTYGMKATHGLVPYTGAMPIETTIDHLGPITGNVADNALMLEVMAGPDGLDPRQQAGREAQPYSELMKGGVKGLRIGIVSEGFGRPNSMPALDAQVRKAAERFTKLGAKVGEVSIPWHSIGAAVWLAVAAEGATQQMMKDNGHGFNWRGLYVTSMVDYHAGWKARADELSESLKLTMVLGEYFIKHYRGHFYAKAQNLTRQLTKAYDDAFRDFDLLLMPTLPITATPIPKPGASVEEIVARALEHVGNTCVADSSGHPAMSIPCGLVEGLPVGMMLIGKFYDEGTIYRAAHAFEQSGDWQKV